MQEPLVMLFVNIGYKFNYVSRIKVALSLKKRNFKRMLILDFQIVHRRNILDEFYLIYCSTYWELLIPNEILQNLHNKSEIFITHLHDVSNSSPVERCCATMDTYLVSLLHYVIQTSVPYRSLLANQIMKNKPKLKTSTATNRILITVNLIPRKQEIIDYKGNEMFELSCLERRELDVAMAWLSTLGGAFSALGDSIESCATIAGKISVRQMQIAVRLGDPYLVARCKLYMALSLIQKHYFKQAKKIVLSQYHLACHGPIKDNKLKSMCLGIWAKLKYDKQKLKIQDNCV